MVEIRRISPAAPPPGGSGKVIVREVAPGQCEVWFNMREGPVRVYSSNLGLGDDFQCAIDWAVSWATRRHIEHVYVVGDDQESAPQPS